MSKMKFTLPDIFDTANYVYKPVLEDIERMKIKYDKLEVKWMVLWDLVYKERGLDFDIREPTDKSKESYTRFVQKFGNEAFEKLKEQCSLINAEYNIWYISHSMLTSKIHLRSLEWNMNPYFEIFTM